ncbi:MAG: hypothetical protein IKX14_06350 [Neisseriaceae bacterium]|nr:hypothetical protein [Neisseriaceae bacterium]
MAVVPYDDFVYTFRVETEFEEQAREPYADFWGGALLFVGDGGADDVCVCEYNFCIQGENGEVNSSAIYAVHRNEDGEYDTNHCDFEHYEVDINDPHWKAKLFKAMVDFYTARIDKFK